MTRRVASIALVALALFAAATSAGAAEQAFAKQYTLRVDSQASGKNVPVSVAIDLPGELAKADDLYAVAHPVGEQDATVPAQVVPAADGYKLWWILPTATIDDQMWNAVVTPGRKGAGDDRFRFKEGDGHLDVLFGGRPVLRYMHARDTSTKERAHETYKVYTHVFEPDGEGVLTKGAGGRYTHHRGIFLGYSKLRYDEGKQHDWWHMKGVTQEHQSFKTKIAGPVLARFTSVVHWLDGDGKPVIVEERTHTVFRQPKPTVAYVCCRSELTAARSDVVLAGDPEHAGYQFRASNKVAENKSATYRFPEGVEDVKKTTDLAWAAVQFKLGDRLFTVQHMNHPLNPEGAKTSAYRDYGRFGFYPKAEVAKGETLTLRYRLWIRKGGFPERERLTEQRASFAEPPEVTVAE